MALNESLATKKMVGDHPTMFIITAYVNVTKSRDMAQQGGVRLG